MQQGPSSLHGHADLPQGEVIVKVHVSKSDIVHARQGLWVTALLSMIFLCGIPALGLLVLVIRAEWIYVFALSGWLIVKAVMFYVVAVVSLCAIVVAAFWWLSCIIDFFDNLRKDWGV